VRGLEEPAGEMLLEYTPRANCPFGGAHPKCNGRMKGAWAYTIMSPVGPE